MLLDTSMDVMTYRSEELRLSLGAVRTSSSETFVFLFINHTPALKYPVRSVLIPHGYCIIVGFISDLHMNNRQS
jgi:hypothetical protein